MTKSYQVDCNGYYGEFGGAYIPEILHKCVEELKQNYLKVIDDESFQREYHQLLRVYVGLTFPLFHATRPPDNFGATLYTSRGD